MPYLAKLRSAEVRVDALTEPFSFTTLPSKASGAVRPIDASLREGATKPSSPHARVA